MRLGKYLEKEREEAEKIVDLLMKDCKPFLTEIKGGLKTYGGYLYRGIRGGAKILPGFTCLGEVKPRKDRKPKDTPFYISRDFDIVFKDKFGWRPRSQGVFVTSDQFEARDYGLVHLFFPKGTYKYVWSLEVKDFYSKTSRWWTPSVSVAPGSDEYWEDIKDMVGTYKQTGLKEAIKMRYEISFLCKSYYCIQAKSVDVTIMVTDMLQDRLR